MKKFISAAFLISVILSCESCFSLHGYKSNCYDLFYLVEELLIAGHKLKLCS